MPDEQPRVQGQRWQVPTLAVLFFGPVVLAWLMVAMGWYPEATTNHGQLVDPATPVTAADWRWADGSGFDPRWFEGRWTLLAIRNGGCGDDCHELLDKLARARLAQDKDMTRVAILLASGSDVALSADRPVRQVRVPEAERQRLIDEAGPGGEGQAVYVVDNQGLRMMTYPLPLDTRGLADDLERLLDNADKDVERIQRLRREDNGS